MPFEETKNYYKILKPYLVGKKFKKYRMDDVGRKGHFIRLVGYTPDGRWLTRGWMVSKRDADRNGNRIMPRTKHARKMLATIGRRCPSLQRYLEM